MTELTHTLNSFVAGLLRSIAMHYYAVSLEISILAFKKQCCMMKPYQGLFRESAITEGTWHGRVTCDSSVLHEVQP